MKKYLSITVGLMLVSGTLPVLAANEVTIDPNVEISVSSYTLVVSGTAKIIDSLSVADSNFTVTLSPGATFSVTSADKRKFSYSVGTGITAATHCTGSSYVSFAASSASEAAADATITPSTTETCDGTTTAAAVTGSTSGGGGSGGSNNPNATIFSQTATTASAAAAVQLPAQASSVAVAATSGVTTGHVFATPLKLGSKGTDVSELQKVLVAKGYLAMPSGAAYGTFGSLTQSAVKKYQAANGIDQLGNVGPATRAKLNASVAAPVSTPAATASTQASSAQIEVLQTQLQALQAQLLMLLSQQMELLKAQQ
ncbi:MAG: peptidoglycan-binding domain-containing protein [bacterium]|nr:peptidoglycan-binding domain-containing protein [bacterium]